MQWINCNKSHWMCVYIQITMSTAALVYDARFCLHKSYLDWWFGYLRLNINALCQPFSTLTRELQYPFELCVCVCVWVCLNDNARLSRGFYCVPSKIFITICMNFANYFRINETFIFSMEIPWLPNYGLVYGLKTFTQHLQFMAHYYYLIWCGRRIWFAPFYLYVRV